MTSTSHAKDEVTRPVTVGWGVTMHLSGYRGVRSKIGGYRIPGSDLLRINVGFEHTDSVYAPAEANEGQVDQFTFMLNGRYIKPSLYLVPGNKRIRTMFYSKATMSGISLKDENGPTLFEGSWTFEFSEGGGVDITVNSWLLDYSALGFGYRMVARGDPPDAYLSAPIFGEFMTGSRVQLGRLIKKKTDAPGGCRGRQRPVIRTRIRNVTCVQA